MTFNKAFKDAANFSTVHKAKKTGVAKQDLAGQHLRDSMGSQNNALSIFSGMFWYPSYLTQILVLHEKCFILALQILTIPLKQAPMETYKFKVSHVSLLILLGRKNIYGAKYEDVVVAIDWQIKKWGNGHQKDLEPSSVFCICKNSINKFLLQSCRLLGSKGHI